MDCKVAHWIVGVDGTTNLAKITMTSARDYHNLQTVGYRELFGNQHTIPKYVFMIVLGFVDTFNDGSVGIPEILLR